MQKLVIMLTVATFLFAGSLAIGADGEALYARCKGCHGADGSKVAAGSTPDQVIKGMSKEKIKDALIGYKEGTYGGPKAVIMEAQMKRYSDEDIEVLSEYIANF